MDSQIKSVVLPKIGKVFCHLKSDPIWLYREIFENRDYLQNGIELNAGDIVFDVGANIGMFTLFAAGECERDVTIFAFEPIPDTYRILEKNVTLHALDKRCDFKLFNLGLTHTDGDKDAVFYYNKEFNVVSGNKPGVIREHLTNLKKNPLLVVSFLKDYYPVIYYLLLLVFPIRSWLIRRNLESVKFQNITCRIDTLSNIIRKYSIPRIDMLKIDVEGAELDVLRGIETEHWLKIKQIVIEVHQINKSNILTEIKELLLKAGLTNILVIYPDWSKEDKSDVRMLYATH